MSSTGPNQKRKLVALPKDECGFWCVEYDYKKCPLFQMARIISPPVAQSMRQISQGAYIPRSSAQEGECLALR
jgi:hypothetical protein